MKKKKNSRAKYGVFNGTTVSNETLGVEKSLIINEYDDQDLSIEKTTNDDNIKESTIVIDENVILNEHKRRKNPKVIKWIVFGISFFIVIALIVFLVLKIGI